MTVVQNKTTFIGLFFISAFFIQFFLKLEWEWLVNLQRGELYKRWSGLGLAFFILFQWLLSLTRVVKKWRVYNLKMQNSHKWLGALSPLFFFIHSASFGYGYLLLMSYFFFANALLGYINLDVVKNNSEILFKGWMIAHVALSLLITFLMFFHIGIVFYYK